MIKQNMTLKNYFTTYTRWKLFSFTFKQFIGFIKWIFLVWWVLTAMIFIFEPYYIQQIKAWLFWNIEEMRRWDEFMPILINNLNENEIEIQNKEVFSWTQEIAIHKMTTKDKANFIKIDNLNLYKVENVWEKIDMKITFYNQDFTSLASPFRYDWFDHILLEKWDCAYIGWANILYMRKKESNNNKDTWKTLDRKCVFIPTWWKREKYPHTLLIFEQYGKSQEERLLTIKELDHYRDED